MNKVIIIAEAGVNHNGDIALAKQLIDAAKTAKVDYVKFQTFKSEYLVSKTAKKAAYQIKNLKNRSQSQMQMLRELELSHEDHEELISYCTNKKISFFSTAFDIESLVYLKELGLKIVKIPSGEITNLPYLKKAAELFSEVIISTGMSTFDEVKNATAVFVNAGIPKNKITILHCNTEYPTPLKDVNLLAMKFIKERLKVNVGYSDHTSGIEVAIAAVALGAKIIEKHFTLDRSLPGPDHSASLEPNELKNMVNSIRNIEKAISGNGKKEVSKSEKKNVSLIRKSLFFKKNLQDGHVLQENDIIALRPGVGISPMLIEKFIGKKLNQNVKSFSMIQENHFQ